MRCRATASENTFLSKLVTETATDEPERLPSLVFRPPVCLEGLPRAIVAVPPVCLICLEGTHPFKKKNPNQISSGPQSPLSISVSVRKGCHSLHTPRLPLMHMDSPPTRLRHHTPASLCSIFLKESFYYRRRERPPPPPNPSSLKQLTAA